MRLLSSTGCQKIVEKKKDLERLAKHRHRSQFTNNDLPFVRRHLLTKAVASFEIMESEAHCALPPTNSGQGCWIQGRFS